MTKEKLVLLVEDDEAIAELIKEYISEDGIKIDYANNGNEALKKISAKKYDVIISDNTLPDVDGTKVIEEGLKKDKDTITVIMTGSEDPAVKEKAMKAGAKHYVVKDTAITFMQKLKDIIK
ncbi:MAG TPA: response regulator [Rickettsiales bacterium]|nr:response regulator [Rickettsiales bacterium]